MLMAISEEVLAVIAVAILAKVAIAVMRRPPEREKKQTHAVCDIFCKALYEAKQFATYVEGRSTINEAIRERLIELLREFLGKLDSVKPELEQPIAYELVHTSQVPPRPRLSPSPYPPTSTGRPPP